MYNEVSLTASIPVCEYDISYEWSDGSTTQNIVVPTQTETYSVIITCGVCIYTAYYNTNGCLVGLPCNDGLDCTENDEVQKNCECHGTNIENLGFTFTEDIVYKSSCDYDACLPSFTVYSKFVITSVDVILEDGSPFQLNKGLNSQGFDFPYCISNGTISCNGLPTVSTMASHISTWLGEESSAYVGNVNDIQLDCFVTNAFYVTNSTIEFVAINGYNDFIEELAFPFNTECNDDGLIAIGANITAIVDCETEIVDEEGNTTTILPTYTWSDGTQSHTAYIPYNNNGYLAYCLEVTATCMDGCTYTGVYGNNCEECTFGSPCAEDELCTINFTYDEECNCVGLPLPDSDGDGFCDADDDCPLGDDNIDLDGDGIPDACDPDVNCDDLTASINIETSNESCSYCLLLNDPIFIDPEVTIDVYLQSISIIDNGQPKLLNASNNEIDGFNFPYLIDRTLPKLLPQIYINDIAVYLDEIGEGDLYLSTNPISGGCLDYLLIDTENGEVPEYQDIKGPVHYGNVDLPTILQSMTFVWGGNNFVNKYFYNPDPCEDLANPFTLEATLSEECGGEPTYEWNTGEISSSIQVPSLAGVYSVTITCGVCTAEAYTNPVDGGCVIGESCPVVDECDNTLVYNGYLDAYCQCIIDNPIQHPDEDGDGIPDCIDCPSEITQISASGEELCCDQPPALIYDTEPAFKTVYNYCAQFKDDDKIYALVINGTYINSTKNYKAELGDFEDNFFHFPYCIEDNCSYYGQDIDIPYTLKDLNRLAYDLQKWAVYNGHSFTTSTTYDDSFCNACGTEGNILFINGKDYGSTITLYAGDAGFDMEKCEDTKAFDGYYVRFAPYDGDCKVTSVVVKTQAYNSNYELEGDWGINLNYSEMKFGPVPHIGVGFKAIVTCEGGCIYEVVTEDADCIVGEPCDSPDVCATMTYTSYDNNDCKCIVLESNDRDEDGVCDDEDICPENLPAEQGYNVLYDDNLDADDDGIPDGCDDVLCGATVCNYVLDLTPYISDGDFFGCMEIKDLFIRLPNGTVESLGDVPFSASTFDFGWLCDVDQAEELVNYIENWFYYNGYVVGGVSYSTYNLTITGTNIEFLYAVNDKGDEINFLQECEPVDEGCSADYTFITNTDACTEDMVVWRIWFEMIGLIDENSFGFNFPYGTNFFNGPMVQNPFIPNFINDLTQAYPNIIVDFATDIDGKVSIKSNFEPVKITFTCRTISGSIWASKLFTCGSNSYSCDDGWDCTINDQYDENCNCVGTFIDSDNDMVCDPLDQCPGYPDYLDSDNDGIPDCKEDEISVDCEPSDIPYCDFIVDFLSCASDKVMINDLALLNTVLREKLITTGGDINMDMLAYLPFPLLANELAGYPDKYDDDGDGIVDMLDPDPCHKNIWIDGNPFKFWNNNSWIFSTEGWGEYICENCLTGQPYNEEEMKERATILNMLLYTVNPGVLVGSNPDDSNNPVVSGCFADAQEDGYLLDETDYNEAGHFYSGLEKCYVYFELDCSCNCIVKETQAINLVDDRCKDPIVIGDECTTDIDNAVVDEDGDLVYDSEGNPQSLPGFHFVECPPNGSDPCAIFGIVSNQNYDPYNPEGAVPCSCEQQMLPNGEPSETIDSDGDTVCDIIDVCAPAEDENGNPITDPNEEGYAEFDDTLDSDGDGVPDCIDLCDGVNFAATQDEANELLQTYADDDNEDNDETIIVVANKEGYGTPSGPGDVCDDGNSCTYDDVITQDCECAGVYIDSDDDGVYDCEDCEYEFVQTNTETIEVNGEDVEIEKDIYGCATCGDTPIVEVDAIGNLATADTPPGEIRTLVGCDVCPGIPDGDPLDIGGQYEGDLPMDYNDNGLPDCIDPPFKPICPDEFEIVHDLGLVLRFYTDNLSEGDYPEPITFQAVQIKETPVTGFEVGYLVVAFTREVIDEETGELYTEVVYESDNFIGTQTTDLGQVNIIYSDHQSCSLGGGEPSSLPCPTRFEGKDIFWDLEPGVEIDLSDLSGTIIFDTPLFELESNASNFVIDIDGSIKYPDFTYTVNQIANPYTGTVTLPSGLVCTYDNGVMPQCSVEVNEQPVVVSPGDPCDDGNECTNHDKWNADCECEGEANPDEDNDGFCDAIDPCPEDWNVMPTSGLVADIDDCPCPALELSTLESEIAGLQNGNDFYVYFASDLSGYSNITVEVDNGQDDVDGGGDVAPVSPIVIGNLQGGYNYTITITAHCENGTPQVSTFDIDVPFGDNPIICGVELDEVDLSTYSLLPQLVSGETFIASDFEINVKASTGSFGKFKGKGYIKVPFFNQARINVKFENIVVSSDRQMIDGFIEVDGFGLAILGDDLSDAINGSLDSIIGVLTTFSEVLEELIPILENIEDLIEEIGHLGDPLTIKCIKDNSILLEELISLSEATPKPSDAQLAQIKLDIEKVSAVLKKCKDDLDDQIEAILLSLSDFIPYFIHEVAVVDGMCNDMSTLEADYDLNNDKYKTQFDDDVDALMGIWSQSNSGLESPEKVSVFEQEVSTPIFDENDLESYYIETILQFDFCRAVTSLDLGYQSISDPTPANIQDKLSRAKVFLEILTEAGSVVTNELSVKKKNGDSNESIYTAHKEDLILAFKNVLIKKAYKN
ncbi:MAG: hypothetical protein ACJATI_003863 [Halioglobus sp.]